MVTGPSSDESDAYVRRMVVNANVSQWRRTGRRELVVADVRPVASSRDDAEALATADAVWRVCSALPRRQRAAVVLRFYEDLEYDEIARILDCSQVTVRSQIHRALASLRAELRRQEEAMLKTVSSSSGCAKGSRAGPARTTPRHRWSPGRAPRDRRRGARVAGLVAAAVAAVA